MSSDDSDDDILKFMNPNKYKEKQKATGRNVNENELFQFKATSFKGAIENRVKRTIDPLYNPAPKRPNLGTTYAKEIIDKEEALIFQNQLNLPGTNKLTEPIEHALDEATKHVYNRYSFNIPNKTDLPIYQTKQDILHTINENPVTIITAETGSGKTTQIPQYVLEDCRDKKVKCNIVVTQPRRIAAQSIATRVAAERKCQVGSLVGYQIGLQKKFDMTNNETRLLYCTTGVLLQKLIRAKNMNQYTHIFVDEVHERDSDVDFLLIVIRKHLTLTSPNVKIILMSATIQATAFRNYFKVIKNNAYLTAPLVNAQGERRFQIHIKYLDKIDPDLPKNTIEKSNPTISDEIFKLALKIILNCLEQLKKMKENKILVFLPGLFEIETFEKLLIANEKKFEIIKEAQICILHSIMSMDTQKIAFEKSEKPRIILATNIAESSITIPDVKFVIDFCLTKYLVTDSNTKLSSLELFWTSRNSCDQRAGRCGRVSDGYCYRLVFENFFKHEMGECCIPEIVRTPLENVVLKSKILDMGTPKEVLALALQPPNETDILNAILSLKEVGALTRLTNNKFDEEDGELTFLGKIMAALPLSVNLSRLVIFGYMFSVLNETVIIAAGLNFKSIFSIDLRHTILTYISKIKWAASSGSDCIAILNAFEAWIMKKDDESFNDPEEEIKWCKENLLERKILNDVLELVKELHDRLENLEVECLGLREPWTPVEKEIVLKACFAGAFYPNVYLRRKIHDVNASKIIKDKDFLSTVYLRGNKPELMMKMYEDNIKDQFVRWGICKDKYRIKVDSDSDHKSIFVRFEEKEHGGEYKNDENVLGRIRPEVYIAIKNKMLGNKISIKIMRKIEAESFAVRSDYGLINDLGFFHFFEKYFEKPGDCVIPSLYAQSIRGEISHIEHCSRFWFRPLEGRFEGYWNNLVGILQQEVPSKPCLNSFELKRNLKVFVKYKEKTVRGRVVGPVDGTPLFRVYLLDYGCYQIFKCSDITVANCETSKLFKYPPRVFQCYLYGIRPSSKFSTKFDWQEEAVDFFRSKTNNVRVIAEIFSVVNDIASVKIFLNDLQLNELMVERGYAEYCEEFYASKVNHLVREKRQRLYYNRIPLAEEFKDHIDESMALVQTAPHQNDCTIKIEFNGPSSPLETILKSVSKFTDNTDIKIEPTSINHVMLETEPEDVIERLYVGANVYEKSMNNLTTPSSITKKIVVRETNAMPNIPGFAVIAALIFCPFAEIRYNKDQTRYTTILTGLGFDPATNYSYFPDRDSILNVDVELDESDLIMINQLRFCMSRLVELNSVDDETPPWQEADRFEILGEIKKHFLDIINKERFRAPLENDPSPFTWNRYNRTVQDEYVDEIEHKRNFPEHFIPPLKQRTSEEIEDLRKHLEELEVDATLDIEFKNQKLCQVCNFLVDDTHDLNIHLMSKIHKDQKARIMN